jgi:hypothetical protein
MQRMKRTLLALILFGIAFGYVEASVVVYLRTIFAPIRQEAFRAVTHNDIFPLLSVEDLKAAGPEYASLLGTEFGREAATIVMLAAAGLAMASNFRQWLAGFMIAFGVWDIFYYVFLRLLIGWPESLMTWDILFLVPVPWVGPVISPVLISVSMIVAGWIMLWCEAADRPLRFGGLDWAAIFAGGLTVIVAFCWDCPNTAAGGWPQPFNWPLFAVGEAIGVAGFLHAFFRRQRDCGVRGANRGENGGLRSESNPA